MRKIFRATKRRFQEPLITNSNPTAMLGKLDFVDGQDQIAFQKTEPAHFANSRSTLWRLRMISRANSIFRANSGSDLVTR